MTVISKIPFIFMSVLNIKMFNINEKYNTHHKKGKAYI